MALRLTGQTVVSWSGRDRVDEQSRVFNLGQSSVSRDHRRLDTEVWTTREIPKNAASDRKSWAACLRDIFTERVAPYSGELRAYFPTTSSQRVKPRALLAKPAQGGSKSSVDPASPRRVRDIAVSLTWIDEYCACQK